MTDTQSPADLDESTARRDLEALEQTAIDGGTVTPTELAEARERVSLAGLFARGRAQREQARQEAEKAAQQAAAKAQAAELLANQSEGLSDARDALTASLSAVMTAVADHNARLRRVGEMFRAADVKCIWAQADLVDVPGIDRDNYIRFEGGDPWIVTADGSTHVLMDAGRTVEGALSAAVTAAGLGRTVRIEQ